MSEKENGFKELQDAKYGSISNGLKIMISFTTLLISYFFREQWNGGLLLQIIGLSVFLIGSIMVTTGAVALGENFTLSHHPKGLVTKGIFSKIRHPMDYGGILLSLGFAVFSMSIYGFVMVIVLVIPLHILSVLVEGRAMLEEYGERYENYKKRSLF